MLLNKLDINNKYFKEGYYIIQDEASSLVACAIGENVSTKYNILDTCAAQVEKVYILQVSILIQV